MRCLVLEQTFRDTESGQIVGAEEAYALIDKRLTDEVAMLRMSDRPAVDIEGKKYDPIRLLCVADRERFEELRRDMVDEEFCHLQAGTPCFGLTEEGLCGHMEEYEDDDDGEFGEPDECWRHFDDE